MNREMPRRAHEFLTKLRSDFEKLLSAHYHDFGASSFRRLAQNFARLRVGFRETRNWTLRIFDAAACSRGLRKK